MIVDGQQQQVIAIADRAIQYGDGCFTTIAYRHGHLEFFDAHLARLKKACDRLAIHFTDWSTLTQSVLASLTTVETPSQNCVVKIIITRGQGGRGYDPQGAVRPSFIITHHVIPAHYEQWHATGISLNVSSVTLANQPLLAGIKHLNRLEQVLVKQALANSGFDDAVVCSTDAKVIETSVGNLFWRKDQQWYTPSLDSTGVEGVMRNLLVGIMQNQGRVINVVRAELSTLLAADEVFVCNSLMQVVSVVNIFNPLNQQSHSFPIQQAPQLRDAVIGLLTKAEAK